MAGYIDDYPLTVEILIDRPALANLNKGQICKAKYINQLDKSYLDIFDEKHPYLDWLVPVGFAKIISEA